MSRAAKSGPERRLVLMLSAWLLMVAGTKSRGGSAGRQSGWIGAIAYLA